MTRDLSPGTMPTRFALALRLRLAVAALTGLAAALAGDVHAFDLEGHRGARGLAPENTLAAFRTALAIGVTTIETDLAVTRDDVLVLSHDPDLNPAIVRDADGRWLRTRGPAIRTLTLEALSRYELGRTDPSSRYARSLPLQKAVDGERVPTFAALVALVRDTPVRLNVETKLTPDAQVETPDAERFARLVAEAVRASGIAARITVQSFDWRTLVALHRIAPEIATACLTSEDERFDTVKPDASGRSPWHAGLALAEHGSVPKLVAAAGCTTWSPNAASVTPARVAEARALKLAVLPWTVNEPVEMERLVEAGVDGLITDYPDRARDVLRAKGIPLPPPVEAR